MSETSKGMTRQFKAEVKQVLDIVINSLYTNKEIFVRELVSNASDALEKMRHLSLVNEAAADQKLPLEIHIETEEKAGIFTITDTGVGLTEEEAELNLGTIAHSGSQEFFQKLAESSGEVDSSIIGQFGVGFYSAFMVAKTVFVASRSWQTEAIGVFWESDGSGTYTIRPQEGLKRGTKITLALKDDAKEFSQAEKIKDIIQRYSNFVPFTIYINGKKVNTVQALWKKSKGEISNKEYNEFYKFVANAPDDPTYTLHFNADAPLQINSILFTPKTNFEKFNFGRMEPGVHLYCRNILIQHQVDELLPEYFRFIRGVVDSADLPLNISRETMQDSALVAKLRHVLTKRLIKFLSEEAENCKEKYDNFFKEFGIFIKEGVTADFENRESLAKLLRFASSATKEDETISLDTYISRLKEGQTAIYYLSGPNRATIEAGPYLEALNARDIEVLYLYDGIDDFVLSSLHEYEGKKLVSADQADLGLSDLPKKEPATEKEQGEAKEEGLSEREAGNLARWIKEILGKQVDEVRVSQRLVKSPAVLVNPNEHLTTGMQRILQAASREQINLGRYILEINPDHAILQRLNEIRHTNPKNEFAKEAVGMLFDNALIAAGMLIDPKMLVERSTHVLERALNWGSEG